MYKNEEILTPPGYKPTENEIALAKTNYVMQNYIYSMLNQLSAYYNMQQGIAPKHGTPERCDQLALDSVNEWKKVKDNWKTGNLIDAFINEEEFQEHIVEALSSMHIGDCTSFPSTCERCYAEGLFNIDYSATWNQHEGAILLEEYCTDYNQKNPDNEFSI